MKRCQSWALTLISAASEPTKTTRKGLVRRGTPFPRSGAIRLARHFTYPIFWKHGAPRIWQFLHDAQKAAAGGDNFPSGTFSIFRKTWLSLLAHLSSGLELRKPFYRLVAPLARQPYPLNWSSACPASFVTRRCRAQIGEAELARNSQITFEARGLTLSRPWAVWLEDPRADSQPSLAAGKINGARPDIIPRNSPFEFQRAGRATSGKKKKTISGWFAPYYNICNYCIIFIK